MAKTPKDYGSFQNGGWTPDFYLAHQNEESPPEKIPVHISNHQSWGGSWRSQPWWRRLLAFLRLTHG